jgi:hypothetical protein
MRQEATKEDRRESISGDGICTLGIDDNHAHVQVKLCHRKPRNN